MGKRGMLSLVEKKMVDTVHPPKTHKTDIQFTRQGLLKHYVQEGAHTLQGIDNMGNFLVGLGVLMLGYLLNVQNKELFVQLFIKDDRSLAMLSGSCLFAWAMSIVLLLWFMHVFIFHLLAGRRVHASHGKVGSIGERMELQGMSYPDFERQAPDFETFVEKNYLPSDQEESEQLWYATFRYTRYMALRKLMVMKQMRSLLAWAMLFGVLFKTTELWFKMIT